MSKLKFIVGFIYWVSYAAKEVSYAAGEFLDEYNNYQRKREKKRRKS